MELAVKLENVCKSYNKQLVLDKVNINIYRGSIYGLVGANGAGKTTVMKSILGLTGIDLGTIEIFGSTVHTYRDVPFHKIGNIVETPSFYPELTAYENLQVMCKTKGIVSKKKICETLEKVGLQPDDKKVFSNFSLGMKQRLGLANAIILNPILLILDEPINGLDPEGRLEVRNILRKMNKELGTTILISSHILSEIEEICDTVGALKKGKMIEECPVNDIYNQKRYIMLKTNNAKNAAMIMERELGIHKYEVMPNGEIKVFFEIQRSWELNALLVRKGIHVEELRCSNRSKNSMEDFYLDLMGEKYDRVITS